MQGAAPFPGPGPILLLAIIHNTRIIPSLPSSVYAMAIDRPPSLHFLFPYIHITYHNLNQLAVRSILGIYDPLSVLI